MVNRTDVLGLALLLIGVVLTTVAIPTQEWTTYGGSTLGLWRICPALSSCTDIDNSDDLDAVRAMVLMGDIIALLGVVVTLVAFLLETVRDMSSRWTKLVVASAALLAGGLVLAGVIVYTVEIHDDIETSSDKDKGYSFWLAICALIFMFASAFVFIVSTFLDERARLKLVRKTAELRERARDDRHHRKNQNGGVHHHVNQNGRGGRSDVVRTPEGHLINNVNKQNGHRLPNGTADDKYRRRHRSASPPGRRDYGNVVWDRYQHKYVPRLVPAATVLPETDYLNHKFGLPLGAYHHVDPVGPRGYISYVGNRGHRRSPSDGYPGFHSFTDWRRQERLLGQGYTPYSDPYLFY